VRFTIADDEAVRALVEKLVGGQASNQARREKLLRALDDATRLYKDSNQKVRRAFHGLLTGYAVALKLGLNAAAGPQTEGQVEMTAISSK
jgi:hypothetical protein